MNHGEDHLPELAGIPEWRPAVVSEAEDICEHRLSFFDLVRHELGREIKWNYEYKARVRSPLTFAPRVDYRDYRVTGDAKFVWEPNRHQHLVVLGRAYRLTSNPRYASKALEAIESWIRQCPFGLGMNWRSPLELAVRLINWVWTYELVSCSGLVTKEHAARVLPVAYRHLWSIARNYSCYSSANNHLVGEAAGVYVGSGYFQGFRQARKWHKQSKEILLREMRNQVNGDGGHRELAVGYHLFVLEFFLLAGLAGRNLGDDFPQEYWERLERMFEFVATLAGGGEQVPMFGDCDDGYVLDLGDRPNQVLNLLAIGAAVFRRDDFKMPAHRFVEPVFWLLGRKGCEDFAGLDAGTGRRAIRSTALPESGYYLLQCGHRGETDRISVTFDCGDLGFGPIAAHGHADALGFTLRAFGRDVFVDPGTYDYFSYPQWRDYFRSTAAHNTLMVDGTNQSEMLGPFLWGRRARTRCLRWEPSSSGGTVCGEHDGYTTLLRPVTHRRTLALDGDNLRLVVSDELWGEGEHILDMHLHLAEECTLEEGPAGEYLIDAGGGTVCLQVDSQLTTRALRGSVEPILGWVSRGYHRKQRSLTLRGSCTWSGRLTLITRITLQQPPDAAMNKRCSATVCDVSG